MGEQKVLKSLFFGILDTLKSKILSLVSTMVAPQRYTGFVRNLPFWATGRLERMWMRLVQIMSKDLFLQRIFAILYDKKKKKQVKLDKTRKFWNLLFHKFQPPLPNIDYWRWNRSTNPQKFEIFILILGFVRS